MRQVLLRAIILQLAGLLPISAATEQTLAGTRQMSLMDPEP